MTQKVLYLLFTERFVQTQTDLTIKCPNGTGGRVRLKSDFKITSLVNSVSVLGNVLVVL